jgi:glycosyltransferase involved in cell wall biosynthesis
MRIAVNTIFLQKNNLEGYGYFVQEIFKRLVVKYPQHEFYFLFDREFDEQFVFASNVKPVIVTPKARHALSFKYWYDVKLPLALRSIQPNIVIQPFGFCSLTTKYKQLLVVHDLAFLHYPKFVAKHHLWYYKNFTPKFLKKASGIVTVSAFSKNDIEKQYSIAPEKIDVVFSAAKEIFKPVGYAFQLETKDKYAEGNEYFLFVGGIHPRKNLMNLLKAFSLFKKWQRSNMKLLIAGKLAWNYEDIIKKIETYKHRKDVILLNYVAEDELVKIVASAYAVVFPSYLEGFGVPLIEAMQCEVPVIASNTSSMPEVGGDAALYCDPADIESIADKMKVLYRDENLRNSLIKKGKQQYQKFNWDETARLLWNAVLKITENETV